MKKAFLSIVAAFALLPITVKSAGWDTTFSSTYPAESCSSILWSGGTVYVGTVWGQVLTWTSTSGWVYLFSGGQFIDGNIRFLKMWNGELYVAGSFTQGYDGVNYFSLTNIAKINPTTVVISAVGSGIPGTIYTVTSAAVTGTASKYRGDFLYAGGIFSSAGGNSAENVAAWNGTNWWNINSTLTYGNPSMVTKGVHSLCLFKGSSGQHQLLATGRFDQGVFASAPNLGRFVETGVGAGSWNAVGNGVGVVDVDTMTCNLSYVQGYDCFAWNATQLLTGSGMTAFITLFDTTHINNVYSQVTCLPGDPCPCGYAFSGLSFAKATIASGDPSYWDSGQGWASYGQYVGWRYSSGGFMYGFVSASPSGPPSCISRYTTAGYWIPVTDTHVFDGGVYVFSQYSDFMSYAFTSLYVGTTTPQRWVF